MKPPRSINRRDLLRLRKPLETGLARSEPTTPARTGATDLLVGKRAAMGSYFEVKLGARTPAGAAVIESALDRIATLEQQLSVYRDDSEISLINQQAYHYPIEVEPGLFKLLLEAQRIWQETDSAYDVAAGALSIAWGFFKGPKRVPAEDELAEAKACTGTQHLLFDPQNRTIRFDRSGIVINLGSIGKGYAIDEAVKVIRAHWWPTGALVHGGRSSVYALGSPPGKFADRWEIALRNPIDPERPLGTLKLRNRAIGTSGASFQSFEANGKIYGHILDPRTGQPGDGPASVTVPAPNAAVADALSTAFYLLGIDRARTYIQAHPEIAAVFVLNGKARRPRVVSIGLNAEDYEMDPSIRWERIPN